MATRAFTNVSTAIAPGGVLPITFGEDGLILEFYRCQGGTVGDTTTIVPSDFTTKIVAAWGDLGATDDISTSGSTQVIFTHTGGTGASTSASCSVALLCRRQS